MASFFKKHHDTLNTWGFWAVVGLLGIGSGLIASLMFSGFAAVIGGILGALLGFWLGSLLFTGTLKWLNKQNKTAEWPDNYAYTLDPVKKRYHQWTRLAHASYTVAKKMVFDPGFKNEKSPDSEEGKLEEEEDNPLEKPKSRHQYIDDGFWNSYYRQLREIWAYTSCLIINAFKGKDEGCSKKEKEEKEKTEETESTTRPLYLSDRRPSPPKIVSPAVTRVKQKYSSLKYSKEN